MLQNASVFSILTCKCASRHSGVQFFWHQTSKKWSVPVQFFHILTYKYASRHSRVPFFIVTSKMAPTPSVFLAFSLANALRATAACHFSTSELPKWLRQWGVLCILTCKCASRHSRAPFFNIGTSKSAPTPSVFYHFHLQMCFSPQPRAIFHLSAEQLPPHPPL